jgi:hypothetical protein
MGIAMGDLSSDGMFDLMITHLTEEMNTLWKQGPPGMFLDRTAAAGLASPRWRGTGFGVVLEDFDNGGAIDLAVANGRISRGPAVSQPRLGPILSPYAERNQIFANDGHGHFHDRSADDEAFCGDPQISRGLACGDIHNDGALALLVTAVSSPARLYSSRAASGGHWLGVRALLPQCGGRDAYGAQITISAGGVRRVRWVNPAGSYLCSNDPRAHFGLGAVSKFDAIEIVWPDGRRETFPGGEADRMLTLAEGSGSATATR